MSNSTVNLGREAYNKALVPFKDEIADVHKRMNDLDWYIERVWAKTDPKEGMVFAVEVQKTRNGKTHMSEWVSSPTAALDGLILKFHAEESLGLTPAIETTVNA